MSMLDKIREISKPSRKSFDDLPDMKKDGLLDDFNMTKFTDDSITRLKSDLDTVGVGELEIKVVAVGLRLVILDPTDETRKRIATTELVVSHPRLDYNDLLSTADDLGDVDAVKLLNGDKENKYNGGEYEGFMYG